MKTRLFVILLVMGLLAAMSSAAAAQAPSGDERPGFASIAGPQLTGPNFEPEQLFDAEGGRPWRNPVVGLLAQSQAAADGPAVATGQPGLSFRYVQTFGETEVPYFDDPNHLFAPTGIATDGNNLWVAENMGRRALKYKSDGTFVTQFGKAGFGEFAGITLYGLSDIAVDRDGNVWVTDFSHHVVKFDPTGKRLQELGQIWNSGTANDRFDSPYGIAFDSSGNIYVSDSNNHRVQVFGSGGTYRTTIGVTAASGSDNAHFNSPEHISIYGNQLYVADAANHRVQIYDITTLASPTYVATIGVSGQAGSDNAHLDWPTGVVADANYIYITEGNNNRVQIFTRSSLAYAATLNAGYGQGNNQLWNPTDVAVDSAGTIYVADRLNHRVQQYATNRVYRRTYGTTGVPYATDDRHFNEPHGIAVDSAGNLTFVEYSGHRLVKLNAVGVPQVIVGQPGLPGDDTAHLRSPIGTAVDGHGNIYVVEQGNHRVQVYTNTGAYLATLGTGWGSGNYEFDSPGGIAVDRDGRIYVGDTGNQRVQIYDGNRVYLATLGETGVCGTDSTHLCGPFGVAVDAAGNIYVADAWNRRVQKFNSSRAYQMTLGTVGQSGGDFAHFSEPRDVAIDSSGRIFVADIYNNRVQVFDKNGAYLSTIASGWGSGTGQMREANTVDVDLQGNVYVTDGANHRIQKFAPGVPGWRQVNINGFGDLSFGRITSLLPFHGSLYAAGHPARVWRMTAAGVWSQANIDGFGDTTNAEIEDLAEFNGQLYAATYTWVCDDLNCSTGHTNGPQIWRTADGSTWQNATPAGGIGSGDRYVISLVVFSGQLYVGLAHGDTGRGAEMWRTADGLNWDRVVENGFANDIYNTDVVSLAVYNGNLYAGTRHGDWYDDGHPNGPLGAEVWRSGDGTTWTLVNAPGFGTLDAYRVERLIVFQDALYAYVSRAGGSVVGAEVWRCTEAVCAKQSDWTKMADNGFGVPQNMYLFAGAVSGGHLYAAAYNPITGMQLWRTADGSHWEKATPHDGLGNSNNRYVYRDAMTVFNGRLTLGVYNWASGAGVWQKALTADFIATPTHGAPPLAVQFTNTSAGDFTTSQWDFGDGATSTETSPTHTYTVPGTYAVTLTVGDGAETSTITKPAYIVAKHFTYLPVVLRNYNPYLYDDFNDPAYEGSYNHALWVSTNPTSFQAQQRNGVLVITNGAISAEQGGGLQMQHPPLRTIEQIQQYEARLRLDSDHSGGYTVIEMYVGADNVNGHWWYTACGLGGAASQQITIWCRVCVPGDCEYSTSVSAEHDAWYRTRIEIDARTTAVRFYVDDQPIGSHIPADAEVLRSARFRSDVHGWNGDADTFATRYVDDVRITPAR